MNIEILAIGDELIDGHRVDTNSAWLSTRVRSAGFQVLFHTTVGDHMDTMVAALRTAIDRCDVVLISGGLGPTADDLTRAALAQAIDRPLETSTDALAHIQQLFTARGRPMPPQNAVQAEFPRGARVVANPHGTAPGIYAQVTCDGGSVCHLFALPGVPAELKQMFEQEVAPILRALPDAPQQITRQRVLHCFGMGESAIEQLLPDLIRRGRQPTVGITAHEATISLRIVATGATAADCDAAIAPVEATIRACLGTTVFGTGNDELQDTVIRRLNQRGESLAAVEWGTAGLLTRWLTLADHSAATFRGGIVAASQCDPTALGALMNAAEADQGTASLAVCVPRAAQLIRTFFGATWGIAIGPFPSPADNSESAGNVAIAVAGDHRNKCTELRYAGHPSIRQARYAKHGLNVLRLILAEEKEH